MNLMGMSFKDFVWENNPTALNVTESRTVRETVLPFSGTAVADLGAQKRRVSGEGYFTGEGCWDRWLALEAVYRQGGAGCLRLPGQEPFLAVMDSLKLTGVAGKDLIHYSFSLTEAKAAPAHDGSGVYRAAAGESLWDHAWRHGRPVEELIAANPEIRDIGALNEGEEVLVP